MIGDRCWAGELVDLDPAPGLQPDCSVSDVRRLPDGSSEEVATIPACDTGRTPCWWLEQDDAECYYTATHLKLVVERGGVIPPDDFYVKASCVTVDPDSGPVR